MTLTLAWIRKVGDVEEALIASDSRLRYGNAWDACPKVFPLARADVAMGFCGSTAEAYPYILQLNDAISLHRASMNRSLDLTQAKGHFLRFLNGMRHHIHDLPPGQSLPDPPDVRFVFAGYCWRRSAFLIWQFRFDPTRRTFIELENRKLAAMNGEKVIAVGGNPNFTERELKEKRERGESVDHILDVQREAFDRIVRKVRANEREDSNGFDMEPFEVLRDMVREGVSPFVGGPLQLVKVYQYASVQRFAVLCPWRDGEVSLAGRPLMEYERYDVPVINAETLEVIQLSRSES